MSWRDAKRVLRKDQRWDLVESLEREEKEKLYEDHVAVLNKKKKASFHELLDECPDMSLTSTWKDVKKNIKSDPRFEKFSSSDRVRAKREWSPTGLAMPISRKLDLGRPGVLKEGNL